MLTLALRSLRHRRAGFAATFVSMFLGATILMSFGSLLDTATSQHLPSSAVSSLVTIASVVGGWGLLLVIFAVTSTLVLSVRQRTGELALLKSAGATPGQVRRMILGEAGVLAVVASALAVLPGLLGGWVLLGLLADSGQVPHSADYHFGPIALSMGVGIILVATLASVLIAVRRVAKLRAKEAMNEAATERGRMSRKRVFAGVVFLLMGLDMAIITSTAMRGKGTDAMQTAGAASIYFSIGLALLSPLLLRIVTALVGGPLSRLAGPAGELTMHNLSRRAYQLSSAVMPIILFTGTATGTLYMQDSENAAVRASGRAATQDQNSVETLNFVVIGMVLVFCAILLVNTLLASTARRRREFGQQRLIGFTAAEVRRMAMIEGVVLTATGVLFGTLASLFTVLPFSIARNGRLLPDAGPGIYLGVVATATILTLVTVTRAADRAVAGPAVEAVAAA